MKTTVSQIDTDIATNERMDAKKWFYDVEGLHCCEIVTFQKDLEKGGIRSLGRSRGMEIKEVEKILANISKYRNDSQYEEFFQHVDELDGYVRSMSIHAGGIVVSDLDIDKEFGVITTKDDEVGVRRVSQIDMKELDALGYVKVDALGLTTLGVVNKTCKYLGIERPSPDNLDFEDDKLWNHLIETDGTLIFQFEGEQAYNYLKMALENIKNMKPIDIMTAVSGILRPCGESIKDDFFEGLPNHTGSKIVDKYFAKNNGFLIYQEDFMRFLIHFAGYSNAESDLVRKRISKKSGMDEVVSELKERFPKYFMEHFHETPENTQKVLEHVSQVLLDASRYGFNIAHARPYTALGYLCLYLRYYYPKAFLTASFNEFNGKKEKIKEIYRYMNKYTNIKVESPKFGNASMEYSYDQDKDIIYEGIYGLKGVSKHSDEALAQIPQDIGSYLDVLIYIKENKLKLTKKDLNLLIQIDFFRQFGVQKYLLSINEIFFDVVKYKISWKADTKTKRINSMIESINLLDKEEDIPYANKMLNELKIRGTTSKRMDYLQTDAFFILDLTHPYPSKYYMKGFSLKSGEIKSYRIDRRNMIEGLAKDEVILVNKECRKEKKQLVDGHWVGGTNIYYNEINSMQKVEF